MQRSLLARATYTGEQTRTACTRPTFTQGNYNLQTAAVRKGSFTTNKLAN
jgi:hypothetical protein